MDTVTHRQGPSSSPRSFLWSLSPPRPPVVLLLLLWTQTRPPSSFLHLFFFTFLPSRGKVSKEILWAQQRGGQLSPYPWSQSGPNKIARGAAGNGWPNIQKHESEAGTAEGFLPAAARRDHRGLFVPDQDSDFSSAPLYFWRCSTIQEVPRNSLEKEERGRARRRRDLLADAEPPQELSVRPGEEDSHQRRRSVKSRGWSDEGWRVSLAARVKRDRKSTSHIGGYFHPSATARRRTSLPSSHPSLSPPLTSEMKRGSLCPTPAACSADRKGGKPEMAAATVETLEVGGKGCGAKASTDRRRP